MVVFVDTSALYAILCQDDPNHPRAGKLWLDLNNREEVLIITNYILLETLTLLQRRLGMASVRTFQEEIVPVLRVEWLDEQYHEAALSAFLTANRRQLSLVDCSSFEVMRRLGLRRVFAFDPHFAEQGFDLLPVPG
jgi:predicted nucleic acid-binding protein